MDNHYERLNVHPSAHPDVIRAAYRALAKLHHPDNGSSSDAERMMEVNEAWAVLSDPQRRARHDADLRRAETKYQRTTLDAGAGDGDETGTHTMGASGWGEAAEPTPPPQWAYAPPPPWSPGPPPPPAYTPPPRWAPAPPRPSAPPFAPDPTAVAGERVLAAIVDGFVVALAAVLVWMTTPDCAALRGTVRDCEEIGGTVYVSDDVVSLVVQWLTWVVAIVAVHVVMQALTGATVGKYVFGLRTVGQDGRRPSLAMTVVRTGLAIVDLVPYCVPAVGLVLVITTRGHQRVGDMAAGTFVVSRAAAGHPVTVG